MCKFSLPDVTPDKKKVMQVTIILFLVAAGLLKHASSYLLFSTSMTINNSKQTFLCASGGDRTDRSKRQSRVGQLVRSEIATIIKYGSLKTEHNLGSFLRKQISVVDANVSPDLRQARISVSIIQSDGVGEIEKREAFSWLVKNKNPIRFLLAQQLSHMKSVPDLTFVQTDVGAAVDVISMLDKISTGFTRERIGKFGQNDDELPVGMFEDLDFDDDDDDDSMNTFDDDVEDVE